MRIVLLWKRTIWNVVLASMLLVAVCGPTHAGELTRSDGLAAQLRSLAEKHPGRLGICAQDSRSTIVCVNGDERFSLQSVMKLILGAAIMDAVDQGRMRLADEIVVRRDDLSVYVQPIASIVARDGAFRTTTGDLLRRAIVESDNAATDVLMARLGGPSAVQAFLDRKAISGIRIDRDERHLQSETLGLTWKAEYVDPDKFNQARKTVPKRIRDAAFSAYLSDERDTATPRGMAAFLTALASGKLLSRASTEHLMQTMEQTVTFPDRLRAGVPRGWSLGHKTGTSQTWNGITAATNDVGLLKAPDGGFIAVVAFVANSTAPSKDRASVIAAAARAIVDFYR